MSKRKDDAIAEKYAEQIEKIIEIASQGLAADDLAKQLEEFPIRALRRAGCELGLRTSTKSKADTIANIAKFAEPSSPLETRKKELMTETIKVLRKMATSMGISYSNLKKDALVELIVAKESGEDGVEGSNDGADASKTSEAGDAPASKEAEESRESEESAVNDACANAVGDETTEKDADDDEGEEVEENVAPVRKQDGNAKCKAPTAATAETSADYDTPETSDDEDAYGNESTEENSADESEDEEESDSDGFEGEGRERVGDEVESETSEPDEDEADGESDGVVDSIMNGFASATDDIDAILEEQEEIIEDASYMNECAFENANTDKTVVPSAGNDDADDADGAKTPAFNAEARISEAERALERKLERVRRSFEEELDLIAEESGEEPAVIKKLRNAKHSAGFAIDAAEEELEAKIASCKHAIAGAVRPQETKSEETDLRAFAEDGREKTMDAIARRTAERNDTITSAVEQIEEAFAEEQNDAARVCEEERSDEEDTVAADKLPDAESPFSARLGIAMETIDAIIAGKNAKRSWENDDANIAHEAPSESVAGTIVDECAIVPPAGASDETAFIASEEHEASNAFSDDDAFKTDIEFDSFDSAMSEIDEMDAIGDEIENEVSSFISQREDRTAVEETEEAFQAESEEEITEVTTENGESAVEIDAGAAVFAANEDADALDCQEEVGEVDFVDADGDGMPGEANISSHDIDEDDMSDISDFLSAEPEDAVESEAHAPAGTVEFSAEAFAGGIDFADERQSEFASTESAEERSARFVQERTAGMPETSVEGDDTNARRKLDLPVIDLGTAGDASLSGYGGGETHGGFGEDDVSRISGMIDFEDELEEPDDADAKNIGWIAEGGKAASTAPMKRIKIDVKQQTRDDLPYVAGDGRDGGEEASGTKIWNDGTVAQPQPPIVFDAENAVSDAAREWETGSSDYNPFVSVGEEARQATEEEYYKQAQYRKKRGGLFGLFRKNK